MSKELQKRIFFGLLAAAFVACFLLFLEPGFTFLLGLCCGLLGWREFARMSTINKKSSFHLAGYLWVICAFTFSFFSGPSTIFWVYLALLGSFAILAFERVFGAWGWVQNTDETPERAWYLIQRFVLGTLYIFMMFGFVGPIAMKLHGQQLLFLAVTSVAFGDVFAYFGGRRFGRTKLWPQLSPGKTLQGAYFAIPGAVFGAMIVYGAWKISPATLSLGWDKALVIGLAAGPLGILGDLIESMIKRDSGMKDSGTLIPGHGGLLDRADALVFIFPLVYFLF